MGALRVSWFAAVSLVLTGLLSSAGTASAAGFQPWRSLGRVASQGVRQLSCPTSNMCVGIEGAGSVVVSTNATVGRSRWRTVEVDASHSLAGLSCPSTSFCVATDSAGNVLTSTDPTGTGTAWTVTHVIDSGLGRISCASVSLCVALVPSGAVHNIQQANATGNVMVSTNPAGGSGAWSQVHIDRNLGEECGKDGMWGGCGNSLTGVACPSVQLCVVTDELGEVVDSQNPGNPSPDAWSQNTEGPAAGPIANEWDALACPSDGLCLAICSGYNSYDSCPGFSSFAPGDGEVVAWDPSTFSISNQVETPTMASPHPLHNIWCAYESACFAADKAHLYASSNAGATKPAWSLAYHDPSGISAVACPTASRCIGFDGAGDLLAGGPPATLAQIQTLERAMLLSRIHPKIGSILKSGNYTLSFTAPTAGRLTEVWSQRRANGKFPTIAVGTQTFSSPRTKRFQIKLTASGRKSLRTAIAPLRLRAVIIFAPAGEPSVIVRGQLTLRM